MRALGPYEILDELGRGGMGVVFRARHIPTGAIRALKVLERAPDLETLERFRRETEALARLAGRGVVVAHETGRSGASFWLAMDLMPGGSLRARIAAAKPLEWREACRIAATLARALERAHALGLVHRDVKPENVLFDERDEPRLADWGCVRDLGRSALTQTGAWLGTIAYMAPEQLRAERAGERADVWAIGVVLHECIAGTRPFTGASPAALLEAIERGARVSLAEGAGAPRELDGLLDAALSLVPARRPSAGELAASLEGLAKGRPETRRARVPVLALGLGAAALFMVSGVALALRAPRPVAESRVVPENATAPLASAFASPPSAVATSAPPDPAAAARAFDAFAELLAAARDRGKVDLAAVTGVAKTLGALEKEARNALLRRLANEVVWPETERTWEGDWSDDKGLQAFRDTLVLATGSLRDRDPLFQGALDYLSLAKKDANSVAALERDADAIAPIDAVRAAEVFARALDFEVSARGGGVAADVDARLASKFPANLEALRKGRPARPTGPEDTLTFAGRARFVLADQGAALLMLLHRRHPDHASDPGWEPDLEEAIRLREEAVAWATDDRRPRALLFLTMLRFQLLATVDASAATDAPAKRVAVAKALRESEKDFDPETAAVVEAALLLGDGDLAGAREHLGRGSRPDTQDEHARALWARILSRSEDESDRRRALQLLSALRRSETNDDHMYLFGISLDELDRAIHAAVDGR